jgi:hypothetical protein
MLDHSVSRADAEAKVDCLIRLIRRVISDDGYFQLI